MPTILRKFAVLAASSYLLPVVGCGPDGASRDATTLPPGPYAPPRQQSLLREHSGGVQAVAFAPDGKALASGGEDQLVRLWDLAAGTSRPLVGHTQEVQAVAFSPDGTRLASASEVRGAPNGEVILWDTATATERMRLTGPRGGAMALCFSPSGDLLAAAGAGEDNATRLWDMPSGKLLASIPNTGQAMLSVAFSPDGKTLAVAGQFRSRSEPGAGGLLLWDVGRRADRARVPVPERHLRNLVFTPDGKHLLALGFGNEPHLVAWELSADEPKLVPFGPPQLSEVGYYFALSRDGRRFATSDARRITVLDLATGESETLDPLLNPGPLGPHFNSRTISVIAFSHDGTKLASGDSTGAARVWGVGPVK